MSEVPKTPQAPTIEDVRTAKDWPSLSAFVRTHGLYAITTIRCDGDRTTYTVRLGSRRIHLTTQTRATEAEAVAAAIEAATPKLTSLARVVRGGLPAVAGMLAKGCVGLAGLGLAVAFFAAPPARLAIDETVPPEPPRQAAPAPLAPMFAPEFVRA